MPSLHGNGTRFDPGQPQFGKRKQTQLPVRTRRGYEGRPGAPSEHRSAEGPRSSRTERHHPPPRAEHSARPRVAPPPNCSATPRRCSSPGPAPPCRERTPRPANPQPPTDGAAPDPGAPLPPRGAPRSGDRTATHEGTARREAPGRYRAEHSPRDPRPPPRAALHGSRGGARPRLRTRPGRHAAPHARAVVGLLRAVGGAVGTARRIAPPGAG